MVSFFEDEARKQEAQAQINRHSEEIERLKRNPDIDEA